MNQIKLCCQGWITIITSQRDISIVNLPTQAISNYFSTSTPALLAMMLGLPEDKPSPDNRIGGQGLGSRIDNLSVKDQNRQLPL